MTNREDKIIPDKYIMSIIIPIEEYKKFKSVFWNDKVYEFHVKDKKVVGSEVILGVRAMRVNEFVDILDENKISWRKP